MVRLIRQAQRRTMIRYWRRLLEQTQMRRSAAAVAAAAAAAKAATTTADSIVHQRIAARNDLLMLSKLESSSSEQSIQHDADVEGAEGSVIQRQLCTKALLLLVKNPSEQCGPAETDVSVYRAIAHTMSLYKCYSSAMQLLACRVIAALAKGSKDAREMIVAGIPAAVVATMTHQSVSTTRTVQFWCCK
eukprot:15136-Heterococcus_DN1.PRE.1